MPDTLDRFEAGDRRALARIISLIENESDSAEAIYDRIYARTGQAFRVGVTGPPGAGKSTLVDQLIVHLRERDQTVGVLAVDPTSPFTGGALLGDRVRMQNHVKDTGVFIRSMASRGSLGGLARKADEVADVLDAFGKSVVILETVGVGQSELDVVEASDTTVVVVVPESGDGVQAMKAGLMEIADIFVVNKADRDGADAAERALQAMLDLREDRRGWRPLIVRTCATKSEGVADLLMALDRHLAHLQEADELVQRRTRRVERRVRMLINERFTESLWSPRRSNLLVAGAQSVLNSDTTPHRLADEIIGDYLRDEINL